MLKPPRIIENTSKGHPLIAGSGSGIKVYCERSCLPI